MEPVPLIDVGTLPDAQFLAYTVEPSNRTWLQASGSIQSISAALTDYTTTKNWLGAKKDTALTRAIERLANKPSLVLKSLPTDAPPITVALIDSGIDTAHYQQQLRLWQNPNERADGIDNSGNGLIDDITGWDFVGADPFPEDTDGHGTMMAGLIIRQAPTAQLMNLRVLDDAGEGSMLAVSAAIDYAVHHKAQVINLSLGANVEDSLVAASIQRALDTGVVVVAASGNEGQSRPDFPARIPGVWAAGSINRDGNNWKLSNGKQGKGAQYVKVVSTHVKSLRLNGGKRFVTGTSAAAARLSGVFASLLSLQASNNRP